jgi:hypothetical protein
MNKQTRTLVPSFSPGTAALVMSTLLALGAVALIALGVGLIYFPAGVITAGVGLVALQWQFFGANEQQT